MKISTPLSVIKMISDAIEINVDNPAEYRVEGPFEYKTAADDSYEGEYSYDSFEDEYISKAHHGGLKRAALNDAFKDMEDRKNDWLAHQLREEARILRSGTLSDLGASHYRSCAAKEIKDLHHALHLMGKEDM